MKFNGSSYQEAIWKDYKLKREAGIEGDNYYNIPIIYKVNGVLNIEYLNKSLDMLLEKHEVLRTYVSIEDEKVIQDINDKVQPVLKIVDWSNENKSEDEAISYLKQENQYFPFLVLE